jgi:type IV pilus assembly protein PilE
MMRIQKSQRGFTLVEVIVVAVIVAVLAAIAIPLYTGYIDSSRQNVVQNAAGSAASFCAASRNSGALPLLDAANRKITGASGSSWNWPVKVTVTLGGAQSLAAGGTVTVNHDDDNTKTAMQNW